MVGCYSLIPFYGAAAGFGCLAVLGSKAWGSPVGIFAGVAGALLGWAVSLLARRIVMSLVARSFRREFDRCDNAALFERLEKDWYLSDMIIATLVGRGEPVGRFRQHLLNQLRSESPSIRSAGWRSFQSFFPSDAARIQDFYPLDTATKRQAVLDRLEEGRVPQTPFPEEHGTQGSPHS